MFDLTDDQKDLRDKARRLAEGAIAERAAEVDRTEEYPWDNVALLKDAGFMGMTIPEAYGGQGRSFLDAVLVVEEMAKHCGVTGRIVVEANMGAISSVMRYGSEEQKKLCAEHVLAGDKPAICITEPNAGSAATDMTTRADKVGDKYIINGTKHWITGGGVSKVHLIFARVFENGEEQGIGGFLAIRNDHPGLVIGTREPAMGLRGIPECQVHFKDLEVPESMALIPPQGIRRGFAGLMTAYNSQRVGAGTVALGIAQGAYEKALAYAQEREQFGRPIAEFQGLQWKFAEMQIKLDAGQLLLYRAAVNADNGFPSAQETAIAKAFCNEAGHWISSEALQVMGGMGYSQDSIVEYCFRRTRGWMIAGGSIEILKNRIAEGVFDTRFSQRPPKAK